MMISSQLKKPIMLHLKRLAMPMVRMIPLLLFLKIILKFKSLTYKKHNRCLKKEKESQDVNLYRFNIILQIHMFILTIMIVLDVIIVAVSMGTAFPVRYVIIASVVQYYAILTHAVMDAQGFIVVASSAYLVAKYFNV